MDFLDDCITNVRPFHLGQNVLFTAYEFVDQVKWQDERNKFELRLCLQKMQKHFSELGLLACTSMVPPRLWILDAHPDTLVESSADTRQSSFNKQQVESLQVPGTYQMSVTVNELVSITRLATRNRNEIRDTISDTSRHEQSFQDSSKNLSSLTSLDFTMLLEMACVNLITLRLAKRSDIISIGCGQFVEKYQAEQSGKHSISNFGLKRLYRVAFGFSSGDFFLMMQRARWSPFSPDASYLPIETNFTKSNVVKVSPCGLFGFDITSGQYDGHSDGHSAGSKFHQLASKKFLSSGGKEVWKEVLRQWLENQSVGDLHIDGKTAWSTILIRTHEKKIGEGDTKKTDSAEDLILLWPTELCVHLNHSEMDCGLLNENDNVHLEKDLKQLWSANSESGKGPVDQAFQWLSWDVPKDFEKQAIPKPQMLVNDPSIHVNNIRGVTKVPSSAVMSQGREMLQSNRSIKSPLSQNNHLSPTTKLTSREISNQSGNPALMTPEATMDLDPDPGVTDADFSFFDEADKGSTRQAAGVVSSITPQNEKQGSTDLQPVLKAKKKQEIGSEDQSTDVPDAISQMPIHQNVQPPEHERIPESFTLKDQETPNLDESPSLQRPASHTEQTRSNEGHRESKSPDIANLVALSDSKYARMGRFAFSHPKAESNAPKTQPPNGSKQIPLIGPPRSKGADVPDQSDSASASETSSTASTSDRSRRGGEESDISMEDVSESDGIQKEQVDVEMMRHHAHETCARLFSQDSSHFRHEETNNYDLLSRHSKYLLKLSSKICELSPNNVSEVAQLVVEQLCSSTLSQTSRDGQSSPDDTMIEPLLQEAVPGVQPLDFKAYVSKMDADSPLEDINSLYTRLEVPFFKIRRMGSTWEVLPTALPFWNTLSFAGLQGPKIIKATCLFAENPLPQEGVRRFLDQVSTAYSENQLGSFSVLQLKSFSTSTLPSGTNRREHLQQAMRAIVKSFQACAESIGSSLVSQSDDSFVLYFINTFDHPSMIFHICACFVRLLKIVSNVPGIASDFRRRVILKIVSDRLITATGGLAFLDSSTSNSLAHDVYNSLPMLRNVSDPTDLNIPFWASTELVESVSPGISFQPSTTVSTDLLRDPSIMHIAYCYRNNNTWLTASWTDDTGRYQHKASYYLVGRSYKAILREIWETTMDIIKPRSVHWRLMIASTTPITVSEVETWVALEEESSKKTKQSLEIVLLSVNTSSGLQLSPRIRLKESPPMQMQPAAAPSPGSTPSGAPSPFNSVGTPSKDPGLIVTPSADAESSARLLSAVDEAWCVLMPSSLGILAPSESMTSSVISGYLIKRTDHSDLDAPAVLQVDLIYASTLEFTMRERGKTDNDAQDGHAQKQREDIHVEDETRSLLREIVAKYRNLALLARVRGLDDNKMGITPWHVLVAELGAEGLNSLI